MKLVEDIDYTIDEQSGLMILTASFLARRGTCCGKKCKNCPFDPKGVKGTKELGDSLKGNCR